MNYVKVKLLKTNYNSYTTVLYKSNLFSIAVVDDYSIVS